MSSARYSRAYTLGLEALHTLCCEYGNLRARLQAIDPEYFMLHHESLPEVGAIRSNFVKIQMLATATPPRWDGEGKLAATLSTAHHTALKKISQLIWDVQLEFAAYMSTSATQSSSSVQAQCSMTTKAQQMSRQDMDKARAAMSAIDHFFEDFREHTPYGRRHLLLHLERLRADLCAVSTDTYLLERFGSLKCACVALSKSTASGGTEERELANARGDVQVMRDQLRRLGLLDD